MNVAEPRPERPTGRVSTRGHDLRTMPLPVARPEAWRDPEAAMQALYDRAEAKAIETIDWYLAMKRPKKRASRLLRAAAIVLGSAGALEPVVSAAWLGGSQAQWGYLLLGGAAACVAFDRFFGISTGWMRCMQSAQHLQALLEDCQYDWAATYVPETGSSPDIADRLALLRGFTESVTVVVRGETNEWAQEFSSNLAQLETQTSNRETSRRSPAESALPDSGHG